MKWSNTITRAIIAGVVCVLIWSDTTAKKDAVENDYVPDGFGCSFFDDEGRKIPVHAVKLLVRAEFFRLTLSEIDTIQKYFTITRHICPFKNCPMIDQVRFNGCGNCEEDNICYALDMVHWKNPTWTYDECEDYLERSPTKTYK